MIIIVMINCHQHHHPGLLEETIERHLRPFQWKTLSSAAAIYISATSRREDQNVQLYWNIF